MLGIKEIQNIIPHRYPFLLVDRIESIIPGKSAIGYKSVSFNEYFFQGHFPQEPVMPGVLIIEALAQVCAVSMLSLDEFKGKIGYFAGIDGARFRRKVIPGDIMRLEVEIVKRRGSISIAKAFATVNGERAVEANLTFSLG